MCSCGVRCWLPTSTARYGFDWNPSRIWMVLPPCTTKRGVAVQVSDGSNESMLSLWVVTSVIPL